MIDLENTSLAIIGLGYVGLPLAVAFGKKQQVIGFDINETRITNLRMGLDSTLEVSANELSSSTHLKFSNSLKDLKTCNTYIITVPTPIDEHKRPDLRPLISASEAIGSVLNSGDIVIYESTVFPGATEEVCVPILEMQSRLKINKEFFVGYSPERINPGDKSRRLTDITKVTSGSTPAAAEFINQLYSSVVTAGTHMVSSIRVAEAAKVIENTQRDLNIALINELAMMFKRLDIDTEEVLLAAGTKWNFLPFRPGLVGGHCIGVDPYYLTHKAQAIGYHPEIILAGRRINDGMGKWVVSEIVKKLINNKIVIQGAKALIMGLTFKENCPDLRNTRVVDVITELQDYGIKVDTHDPWANAESAKEEYGIELIDSPAVNTYDFVVIAVSHSCFQERSPEELRAYGKPNHLLCDLKYIFPEGQSDFRI